MAWKVELDSDAERDLDKLDPQIAEIDAYAKDLESSNLLTRLAAVNNQELPMTPVQFKKALKDDYQSIRQAAIARHNTPMEPEDVAEILRIPSPILIVPLLERDDINITEEQLHRCLNMSGEVARAALAWQARQFDAFAKSALSKGVESSAAVPLAVNAAQNHRSSKCIL